MRLIDSNTCDVSTSSSLPLPPEIIRPLPESGHQSTDRRCKFPDSIYLLPPPPPHCAERVGSVISRNGYVAFVANVGTLPWLDALELTDVLGFAIRRVSPSGA